MSHHRRAFRWLTLVLFLAVLLGITFSSPVATSPVEVIVQAQSSEAAAQLVAAYGGTVLRPLSIIDSVAARVTADTVTRLRRDPAVRAVWPNRKVQVTSQPDRRARRTLPEGHYASAAAGVNEIHEQGITGRGVTVALVDTGMPFTPKLKRGRGGRPAGAPQDGSLFYKDRRTGRFVLYKDFIDPNAKKSQDPFGHGTHVLGIIADSTPAEEEDGGTVYAGVAPGVNLVVARALGADGSGTYADVIAAIDWIVSIRDVYGIDVLNLSLYAPVEVPYWVDPLGQAVMRAWQAGLVVVVAAGNDGPTPASVGVPGNVPYVITVGAYKEARFTDSGADELADFSARGPTESRFVKPDVLAPGWKITGPMPMKSALAQRFLGNDDDGDDDDGEGHDDDDDDDVPVVRWGREKIGYFQLSGTSMAAAQVSGLVALMLEQNPDLTNDEVKARLQDTAALAVDETGNRAIYTIWEQGAGKVQAWDAVFADVERRSANNGLDINADLDVTASGTHYEGYTEYDQDAGLFYISDAPPLPENYFVWDGSTWVWAGDTWVWAGGKWVWAGDTWVWAGGTWVWAGDTWVWAGTGKWAWSGSTWVWAGGPLESVTVTVGILP